MSDVGDVTLNIRVVVVARPIEWMAEHVDGVEWPKSTRLENVSRGCMFWLNKFPEGVTQEFDSKLFRAEMSAPWEQMRQIVEAARLAGLDGLLMVSVEDESDD